MYQLAHNPAPSSHPLFNNSLLSKPTRHWCWAGSIPSNVRL